MRVDFEKASVYIYVWGPMRLLGIRAMPQLPSMRFVPISDNDFVVFSLEAGTGQARLHFENRDGEAVLAIGPAERPVVAHRISR